MCVYVEPSAAGRVEYHTIRSLINMHSCQLHENLTLRRMSLVGFEHIPMLVSSLNSTIVFLF
jgi:hypothetical protein